MTGKINKIKEDLRGTALLVAILVMGVLLALSLALSGLVLREVSVTKNLIDAGKAYYAAESGVELALFQLNNNLPGWHVNDDEAELNESLQQSTFKYFVKNACRDYPCIDEDNYDLSNTDARAFYDVLDLNESITIPLFVVDEGEVKSVKDFVVQYYVAFNPATDLILVGDISSWDVLRWRVFGMRKVEGDYITESINDFTAVSSFSGTDPTTNAARPSWFGTVNCDERGDENSGISCVSYARNQGDNCSNLEARDYYQYEENTNERQEVAGIIPCYPISEFMTNHQTADEEDSTGATGLNYLSLTNMMNPAVFNETKYRTDQQREDASKIYFRVETFDDEVVREVAEIVADGYSGKSKQSIRVQKKRDSYMPVFNFSVYSTYGSSHGGDDSWYYESAIKLPE